MCAVTLTAGAVVGTLTGCTADVPEATTAAATQAATEAATEAAKNSIYTPGTYTAVEKGLQSDVTVTMTFDESSITDVVIDASGETEGIGTGTPEPLKKAILDAQSAEVDAVSGATVTSNAVRKAVANCIAQAKGEVQVASGAAASGTSQDDWLGEEPDIKDSDVYSKIDADVVVVGLGVAGVATARAASEAGATVVGIDGAASPCCRSGEYAVINSPKLNARWPERALAREEVDEIIDSYVNESSYRVKRSIAKKWADNIGEAFD